MADDFLAAEEVLPTIKILVVGNGSVGKSSMIRRFCRGAYNANYKKTIGVEYLEKEVEVPGFGEVVLMLWDTAGQEEFDAVTQQYYNDTDAVAITFSTDDPTSLSTIHSWHSKITSSSLTSPPTVVLVQNKIDLSNVSGGVEAKDAEGLARSMKVPLYRVSVKDWINVEEMFINLAERHLKKQRDRYMAAAASTRTVRDTDAAVKGR
ncbi:Gdp-bound Rab23 Gtpase crystallized in P2(1)2(1)2(1) space group [Fimicolochytrium jonesii]|uniref:Gdp-bound Rab23 Gtpase crystallized in P2(1)2(1)2(1) space group n=1 Tax=Fimicolochytrium jonesii TaxID=1396493 RepID=UPI0022FEF3F9|nr:Gdp-bound Rab23 Gtpase crystallized in P2(1)2(1)2(1) space group [Fimicolochytrium jonesii]KAI8820416.1 Gdp-bound Rab23 Gtpase crystallized in P2(1)2(1)2(1) space group [Fimicolochytrium jonesii]